MELNNKWSFAGATLLTLASLPGLAGCGIEPTKPAEPTRETRLASVIPLGQGVYRFDVKHWPQSLVDFKTEHTDLRVTAMFAGEQFGGGTGMSNTSVIVVTEPKGNPEATYPPQTNPSRWGHAPHEQ